MIFHARSRTRPFHYGLFPLESLPRDENVIASESSSPPRQSPAQDPNRGDLARLVNHYRTIFAQFANDEVATYQPLHAKALRAKGWRYWWGINGAQSGRERNRRAARPSHYSRYPMETVRQVDRPTTLIIDDEVPRVAYSGLRYPLCFWRNYDGTEVDVLCETAQGFVAVEIKAGSRWERRFGRGLHKVRATLGTSRTQCHGVYLGEREALVDGVRVHPVRTFLKRLWAGEIFA